MDARVTPRRRVLVSGLGLLLTGLPAVAQEEGVPGPFEGGAAEVREEEPAGAAAAAATEASELELFALDAQLKAETQVGSQKARPLRDSPAVVSVVTREEILNSGARDLLDVLYLVPGFFFGVDVENAVGVGFRGNWGHEGKVLLLLDGQEMNETLFATFSLGNHIPAEQIQAVEVLRGPGSAVYGGFAELAVINVVTRSPRDFRGVSASATYGQYGRGMGRSVLSLAASQSFEQVEGLSASLSASVGQGSRSDATYTDQFGNSFDMLQGSRVDPLLLSAGLGYKDLQLRLVLDHYRTTAQDGLFEVEPGPTAVAFQSLMADATYTWRLSDVLTLTPRVSLKRQEPWRAPDAESSVYYDKRADRSRARLTLAYDPVPWLSAVVGGEGMLDRAMVLSEGPSGAGFNGASRVRYGNVAGFAELLLDTPIVNVTAGARYEHHSAVGQSFVPRLALTRRFGPVHAKALASGAFRAPSIENINLAAGQIAPERTAVLELELGWQVDESLYLSANAFDVTIGQPIVYFVDEDMEGYRNFTRTGTRGAEADVRLHRDWGYVNLGYSFYTAAGKNEVDLYRVEGDDGALLGMPNHRLTLAGHLRLWRGLSLNPTVVWVGERAGYARADADGVPQLERFAPVTLVNVFAQWRDAFTPGLTLGVGLYNALGADFRFLQPYNGSHAPLPEHPRELLGRVSYTLPLE